MSVPDWVPVNAKIHIDFLGGSPQGRAWVNGTGEVAIDTLLTENSDEWGSFNPATDITSEGMVGQPIFTSVVTETVVPTGFTIVVDYFKISDATVPYGGLKIQAFDLPDWNFVWEVQSQFDIGANNASGRLQAGDIQVEIAQPNNVSGPFRSAATIAADHVSLSTNGASVATLFGTAAASFPMVTTVGLTSSFVSDPGNMDLAITKLTIYPPQNDTGLSELSSLSPPGPEPEPIKGVTMAQAMAAVRARLDAGSFSFPVHYQGDDAALLPDEPADWAFSMFNNEGSSLVAFGGGRGNNVYRNRARNEVFVFAPLGLGGQYVANLAEPVAAQLRSHRDEVISCFMSDVVSVGPGSTLSVPGLSNEVNNYMCAIVETVLFFDQIG